MNQALEALISQSVSALGYDLVEARKGGAARRPIIDVRIDRRDGERVSVDDCARVSRALEPTIELSGLAGQDYVLEVSSPGVERPLRTAQDWRRFAGRPASVSSPSLGGRLEVEVVGVSDADGTEVAVMVDSRGTEHRVPLAQVRDARLVFRWDKVRNEQ